MLKERVLWDGLEGFERYLLLDFFREELQPRLREFHRCKISEINLKNKDAVLEHTRRTEFDSTEPLVGGKDSKILERELQILFEILDEIISLLENEHQDVGQTMDQGHLEFVQVHGESVFCIGKEGFRDVFHPLLIRLFESFEAYNDRTYKLMRLEI